MLGHRIATLVRPHELAAVADWLRARLGRRP